MSPSPDGIYLTDEELKDTTLNLGSKLLLKVIQREIESSGKAFVVRSNEWLAKLLGVSKRSIPRWLGELERRKHIAVVQSSRRVKKGEKRGQDKIRTARYIYIDRRLAGYRRRMLKRYKRPMEVGYEYWVVGGRMSEEAYVGLMRDEAHKERLAEDEAEDEAEHQRLIGAHNEWLSTMTDEFLAEYEKDMGVASGEYRKIKQDYVEKQREYDEDDLFDD